MNMKKQPTIYITINPDKNAWNFMDKIIRKNFPDHKTKVYIKPVKK
jgi:hypothetical protein